MQFQWSNFQHTSTYISYFHCYCHWLIVSIRMRIKQILFPQPSIPAAMYIIQNNSEHLKFRIFSSIDHRVIQSLSTLGQCRLLLFQFWSLLTNFSSPTSVCLKHAWPVTSTDHSGILRESMFLFFIKQLQFQVGYPTLSPFSVPPFQFKILSVHQQLGLEMGNLLVLVCRRHIHRCWHLRTISSVFRDVLLIVKQFLKILDPSLLTKVLVKKLCI